MTSHFILGDVFCIFGKSVNVWCTVKLRYNLTFILHTVSGIRGIHGIPYNRLRPHFTGSRYSLGDQQIEDISYIHSIPAKEEGVSHNKPIR